MEDTIDQSQPVELYEFIGSYQTYRYTSDLVPHTVSSQTYTPLAGLERGSQKIGTHEDDKDELTVSMPIGTDVASAYAFQVTPPNLEIVLRRLDRGGGGATLMWRGPVNSITVKGYVATFKCPSKFSSLLSSRVPTIMVQPQCNHILYDSMCKVSRAANTVNTTVTNVNGRAITLASVGSFAAGHFIGGELVVPAVDERRTVVSVSGSIVTVGYAFGNINVGNSVSLSAGCDHGWSSAQGCTKFSNQVNFGGFPFTPGEQNNVFVVGL